MTEPQAVSVLGDPRFFGRAGPFGIDTLAELTGGTVRRAGIAAYRVLTGVAPLQAAEPEHVSVLHNRRYAPAAGETKAGVVIVSEALVSRVAGTSVALVVADPHEAWARVASLFHPAPGVRPGIHPSAVIDGTAQVETGVEIGPCAVIGAGVEIGAGCRIGPCAVIGEGVIIGEGCRIGAAASISHAILGARVTIYPGARIGQEGFGFAITTTGFVTVPQLGRVILHDDVEIGSNSTVDRGASHDTVIGRGSRIDNLVQIGHNVQMGQHCVMAGQSGMAGSCTLGDFVQIGAQGGLAGHLTVGSRARVGAQAGVMADVAEGADVIGSPALPVREFFRNVAVLRRLARRPAAGSSAGDAAPVAAAGEKSAGEKAAG